MQASETDDLRNSSWVCNFADDEAQLSQRVHYRLIMGTVGESFETVRGAQELLHATYDIFTGEYDPQLCQKLGE